MSDAQIRVADQCRLTKKSTGNPMAYWLRISNMDFIGASYPPPIKAMNTFDKNIPFSPPFDYIFNFSLCFINNAK